MRLIEQALRDNDRFAWVIALAIVITGVFLFYLARRLVVRRFAAYAVRTTSKLDDAVADIFERTQSWFGFALSVYLASLYLTLPVPVAQAIKTFMTLALILQLALWANRGIVVWLRSSLAEKRERDAAAATTLSVLGFIGRVALWSITLLLLLDNLGIDITALLTGLGIGGVAIALAVQNILGDIFASVSIALDKPFAIGDFVVVGEYLGTVEYIGLKATRIRSLSGEQIVFANAELLKSVIRNYKRMYERRVVFHFGVSYQTPYEKLVRIATWVREIVEAQPKVRFDRAHFKAYGDSSLDFEVVYYVRDPDYNLYMDTQQAINLALFCRFAQEEIQFAYPTRTLYLAHAPKDLLRLGEGGHA